MSNPVRDVVPFFGIDREFRAHQEAYAEIMHSVFSHGKVLQGKEVSDFEKKTAAFCDRRYGIAVNSCTDALYFSLLAAGVQLGEEVLVTDFSFVASASCILRLGARPVFVDVTESYNMDLRKAESMVSSKTKAVIFVHLFGQMGNPEDIEEFAKSHGLVLIEDAAQAFGATYRGRKAGSLGLLSCLSFDPTKVIGAPGSGGMVLTNSEELARKIVMLRYHGRNEKSEYVSLGFNSQMPSLTAAILDYKLRHYEEWLARRREIAKYYLDNIAGSCILPFEETGSCHIYHKFVISSKNRDALRKFLSQYNIQSMIHYPMPLHRQPCFANFNYDHTNYPNATAISKEVLSLPVYPFLKENELQMVVEKINAFERVSNGRGC